MRALLCLASLVLAQVAMAQGQGLDQLELSGPYGPEGIMQLDEALLHELLDDGSQSAQVPTDNFPVLFRYRSCPGSATRCTTGLVANGLAELRAEPQWMLDMEAELLAAIDSFLTDAEQSAYRLRQVHKPLAQRLSDHARVINHLVTK